MMIQLGDVVISSEIFTEKFFCDLESCKGACCIEGDAGAPIDDSEARQLEEILPVVWNDLSEDARAVIKKQGVAYRDSEGDLVTSIVNDKDCVFTFHDEKGCCGCAIEKAFREGRCNFLKPLSCHLYPIRIGRYGQYTSISYHKWDVCKAAPILGKRKNIAVYQFLKEPLVRMFGDSWYKELEECAKAVKEHFE